MRLSRRTIEMLLDLVDIRISSMDVLDREDARDLIILERTRAELGAVKASWSPNFTQTSLLDRGMTTEEQRLR